MKKHSVTVTIVLLLLVLSPGFLSGDATSADPAPTERPTLSAPAITLWAATGATVEFKTQNGMTVDGVPPETRDVPNLVLNRNGALTNPVERTVVVEVTGIEVPPPGITLTLSVETQHGDPDVEGDSPARIQLWRASRWIANSTGAIQPDITTVFRHEFTATVRPRVGPHTGAVRGAVATPTDYLRYDLIVSAGRGASRTFSRNHALLLENQWIVALPKVQESSPGAAPDELVVYYTDMVPFRRDGRDAATWLPRDRVSDYLRGELIPGMIEAFRVQTDEWGFPWYPAWRGHRPGEDAERLSVALTDGETWFHGRAPGQGHAAISLNVSRGEVEYATLTDGLMSTFHHELFHTHQRNIHQHLGGSGHVSGADGTWTWFGEGTAVLASSVGQPAVQFSRTWGTRAYLSNAKAFIGRAGISEGALNKSYEQMNPYHAAAYWRFLYEQCGGMHDGVEDPAAGMALIRRVLTTLYSGDIVGTGVSTDLVQEMPGVMDEALRGSPCPFQTHQESLLAFARAVYALRLEGGRCREPGMPAGCGFYDREDLYDHPPVHTLTYRGVALVHAAAEQPYPAGIPGSFGIDLVDVELDDAANGEPLAIEIRGAPGSGAAFGVQILKLAGPSPAAQAPSPEALVQIEPGAHGVYVIPAVDTAVYDRLALIITRLDAEEALDRGGAYTIVLRPPG